VRCGQPDLPLCARPRVNSERRSGWVPNLPKYTRGVLGKYAKVVQSAALGGVRG
jgi:dihydroxy-acid dehydratase